MGTVVVFVVAALFVGTSTRFLSRLPRQAVVNVEEATHWIADRLPPEVSGEVSYEDVTDIIVWHLGYLDSKNVPVQDTQARELEDPLVTDEDEALDHIMALAAAADRDLDPVHITVVLDLQHEYLRAIGAIGDAAPD